MKLCYVLPKFELNSCENFYHIPNFLNELGKKFELYVILESLDGIEIEIPSARKIYVIQKNRKMSIFLRSLKLIKLYFYLFNKGVRVFFIRSSLTGSFPISFANRFLNFNNAKVIFWSCGQDIVPISLKINLQNLKRIFSKALNLFVFRMVNYIATGPASMLDYYIEKFNLSSKKMLLLFNDISLERFYPISIKEKQDLKKLLFNFSGKIILYVHTLNKSRGADLILEIANRIKQDKLNIRIVVVGRPGDFSGTLVSSSKFLDDAMIFIGQIANSEIVKYYQSADLFIMPSRGEGFPRVILESFATHCPVLSFDVGGVIDIIPKRLHSKFLINADNDELFVSSSISIVNDDNLINSSKSVIKKEIDKFDTERVARMYFDVISNL